MRQPLQFLWLLLTGAFFFCVSPGKAQVTLPASGTYTETFDATGSAYPTGWSGYTSPTASALGTAATLITAATAWNNTGGGFKNFASADIGSGGTQATATDRALGVRQVTATDAGAAFAVQLANTSGLQGFSLTFKLQSLDASSPRITTWRVDYGFGASPSAFTQLTTSPTSLTTGGSAFTNQSVTVSFGTALDNQSGPVWIRIVTLTATSGANNRASTGVDDFRLTYVTGPVTGPALTATPGTLSGYTTTQGLASSSKSYTLTAQELTTSITITAPSSFELSSDDTNWSGTLNLPQSTTTATVFTRLTAGAAQGTYTGSITNVSGAQSTSVAVSGTVNAALGTFTKISAIQGAGNTFALSGTQTIEGVVTRAFPGSAAQNGFYVQEEDADQDGNPATSEGIFCYDPTGTYTAVAVAGAKVQVTGTVAEFTTTSSGVTSSLTQLGNLSSVVSLGATTLPSVTSVTLPVAPPTGGVSAFERYEGMLVQMSAASGALTVTETFGLRQYGQVTLSVSDGTDQSGTDGRIDQYTQFNTPSVAGYAAYEAAAALRTIILDDASSVSYPSVIIHARGGNPLSASNTLRAGDDVASITTVLDERFEGYRLQTSTGINFNAANPRPATVPAVGGTLKVGGANVLNYFTTFTSADRGADNQAEFDRQRAKVIANLVGTGADIIGLSEVQNNGYGPTSAIQNLIDGLNASAGAGTYAFITPNATASTDAITAAFIYKPASVSLVGPCVPIPLTYGTGSFVPVGRSALAQTFQQTPSGGIFTLVVNHWKSKGSSAGAAGDTDTNDGQGASAGTRTRQAQDVLQWLATNPTGTTDPDYLIIGDLNSYAKEDPITTLTSGGYIKLIDDKTYSYAFSGRWGSLDHALATSSLNTQVTGAAKWNINSPEPTALDYNTENKTADQITNLFAPDQFRSSDHDPLVVGLNLVTALPVQLINFQAIIVGDQVSLAWETTAERNASQFIMERSSDAREFGAVGRVAATGNSETRKTYGLMDTQPLTGTNYYRLRTVDRDGSSETSKIIAVTLDDVTPTMALMGNPVASNQIQLAIRNMANATYQLRTLTGQAVRTRLLQQTDRAVTLQVDQSLSTGVYLLEGSTSTTRKVVKVVVE